MVRRYLEPAVRDMEHYINTKIHPQLMNRTVVSRVVLGEVMRDAGRPPASFRGLTRWEKATVMSAALRNLGWRRYSGYNRYRINAWTLPGGVHGVS